MSLVRGFLRNVLGSYLASLIAIAVKLALLPFLFWQLGKERYGLWTVVFSFGMTTIVFDMGLMGAMRRFQSDAIAKGDARKANEVLGLSLLLYGGLGIAAMLVVLSGLWWLPQVVPVPPELRGELLFALGAVGLYMLARFVRGALAGVMFGANRIDLTRLTSTFERVLFAGFAVALLLGWSRRLEALAAALLASSALWLVLSYVAARRCFPQLKLRVGSPRSPLLRPMLSFGAYSLLSTLAAVLSQHAPKLAVGRFLGLAKAAELNIVLVLALQVEMLVRLLALPLFGVAARVDRERRRAVYQRGSRICAMFALCLMVPLGVFSHVLLGQWVGPELAYTGDVLILLLAAAWLNLVQLPAVHIIMATERIGFLSWVLLGRSVLFAAVLLAMLRFTSLGLMSVAVASLAASVPISGIVLPVYACRRLGLGLPAYLARSLARPVLSGGLILAASLAARALWRPPTLAWSALYVTGVGVLGLLIAYCLGISGEDRSALRKALPRRLGRTGAAR